MATNTEGSLESYDFNKSSLIRVPNVKQPNVAVTWQAANTMIIDTVIDLVNSRKFLCLKQAYIGTELT